MVWPEIIGTSVEAVQSLDFRTAEEEAIFYGSVARFLESSEEVSRGLTAPERRRPRLSYRPEVIDTSSARPGETSSPYLISGV